MAVVIVWSLVLLFFAWAAWAIKSEVKSYIKKAIPFESKVFGFKFRYPSWWSFEESEIKNHIEFIPGNFLELLDEKIQPLLFFDPSGEGRLRIFALKECEKVSALDTEEKFRFLMGKGPVELDTEDVETIETEDFRSFELESRASLVIDEEPQRKFIRYNLIRLPEINLFWVYDCGVLGGLVDGIFLRKTLKSLKLFG